MTKIKFCLICKLFFLILLTNTYLHSENNIYFMNVSGNIKLFEKPETVSKVVTFLNDGNIVELIEKGEKLTINGMEGCWIKIKTVNENYGWCFDGYLKKMYVHDDSNGYRIFFPYDWYFNSFKIENKGTSKEFGNNYFQIYNYDITKSNEPYNILKLEACIINNKFISCDDWVEKIIYDELNISGKKAEVFNRKTIFNSKDRELIKVVFKNANNSYSLTYYYRNGKKSVLFYIFPANTIYEKEVEGIISNFEY
jgi:hypothetical protein